MWMDFPIVPECAEMSRYRGMMMFGIALVKCGHVSTRDEAWTNGDSHDSVDGEYQFWLYLAESSVSL